MITIAILVFMVPAIFLFSQRNRAIRFCILSGALTALVAIVPITVFSAGLAQVFEVYGLPFLFLVALVEEVFRLAGMRRVFGKDSFVGPGSFIELMFFGLGFGCLEYFVRLAGADHGALYSCDFWKFSSQCSLEINTYSLIAAHALFLHVFLTGLYYPIESGNKRRMIASLGIATTIHWAINSLVIEAAMKAGENHFYLIFFPLLIAIYAATLTIAATRVRRSSL